MWNDQSAFEYGKETLIMEFTSSSELSLFI